MRFHLDFGSRTLTNVALLIGFSTTALAVSPCRGDLTHYYPFSSNVSDSVGSSDGALEGGASVSGGVLQLDGADDYVQFATMIVPTSGSFSVAMLARQTTPQSNYIELISQGGGPGFYLGHDPSGIIRVSDSWLFTGVLFPSDGEFHHFAMTVDTAAGNTQLYVDGSLSATLNAAISMSAGGTDSRFGRQYDGHAEYFGGELDEVRIFDHALSPREVARLAVPEPLTTLLAALGTGLVLLASRRRP